MATIYVDSWLDYELDGETHIGLATAIAGVTSENTDIYLTKDIDMKDELPYGRISASVIKPSNSYIATVYGNGHKISNLFLDTNISVFDGRNYNRLIFNDVKFEDWLLESGKAFSALTINDSEISMTLVGTDLINTSVYLRDSGITITGAGTGGTFDFGDSSYKADGCNIQLLGIFKEVIVSLKNSYLGGEFRQVGSGGFAFARSFCSIIDADINAEKAPANPSSELTLLIVNTDKFILPEGSYWTDTARNKYTLASDSEIGDVTFLKSIGFPVR